MVRSTIIAAIAAVALSACGSGSGSGDSDGGGQPTAGAATATPTSAVATPTPGPTAPSGLPSLRLTEVARDFEQPLFAAAPPGDRSRLFVVEQTGTVRIVTDGVVQGDAFLDLSALVSCCGERGLLGFAFHPEYATNGRFFVNYTDVAGDTVIAEYARSSGDPDRAAPDAVRIFFGVPQPFSNHNGGGLAFGADGFLYIALGDGGGAGDPNESAQDLRTKLGKILRIDVDRYPTPPAGNLAGGDPDIWDYGFRNPFRFSFDRATGDLYIGDVGQNSFEEIDVEPRGSGGRNYGWDITEGFVCFEPSSGCDMTSLTPPAVVYPLGGDCAVIGGYVYRGAAIPGLVGRYLYGDFCSGRIRSFVFSDGRATDEVELTADLASNTVLRTITSFGEDDAGELYVVDGGGVVYRIEPE